MAPRSMAENRLLGRDHHGSRMRSRGPFVVRYAAARSSAPKALHIDPTPNVQYNLRNWLRATQARTTSVMLCAFSVQLCVQRHSLLGVGL
jgi:hypothetical protein